jgi:hypothetical protein
VSSKRRLRRKRCERKVRHGSAAAGMAAIDRMRGLGRVDGHMSVYRCATCGGWHVGHTPGRQPRVVR